MQRLRSPNLFMWNFTIRRRVMVCFSRWYTYYEIERLFPKLMQKRTYSISRVGPQQQSVGYNWNRHHAEWLSQTLPN